MTVRGRTCLLAVAFALAMPAVLRAANAGFGVRGGYAAQAGEPLLGAEALFRLSPRLQLAPSVEVAFPDRGHAITASADLYHDVSCACSLRNVIWVGGGPSVSFRGGTEPEPSRTDFGLDLLVGVGVHAGRLLPFTQLKVIVRRETEVVVTVGLRF